ncbi:MAG: hypothetical protein ACJAVR_003444 [Paracoccaceae bacterium]|jgi:hypothetical protein
MARLYAWRGLFIRLSAAQIMENQIWLGHLNWWKCRGMTIFQPENDTLRLKSKASRFA